MPAPPPRLAVASGKALMSEALIRIPAAKGIRMSGRRVVSQRASNCAMRGAVVAVTGQEVSFIRDLSDFAGSILVRTWHAGCGASTISKLSSRTDMLPSINCAATLNMTMRDPASLLLGMDTGLSRADRQPRGMESTMSGHHQAQVRRQRWPYRRRMPNGSKSCAVRMIVMRSLPHVTGAS